MSSFLEERFIDLYVRVGSPTSLALHAHTHFGRDHVHSFFAELAQLIDKDFLCKLLAGVARSLETEGKS